ncbi:MAG: hypothetical protein JW828_10115 [Sedimentisphaerales bacterium]|nr:hypothetical protein [Sedimentisphaerales bacterium]
MAARNNRLLSILIFLLLFFLGTLKFLAVVQAGRLENRFYQIVRIADGSRADPLHRTR